MVRSGCQVLNSFLGSLWVAAHGAMMLMFGKGNLLVSLSASGGQLGLKRTALHSCLRNDAFDGFDHRTSSGRSAVVNIGAAALRCAPPGRPAAGPGEASQLTYPTFVLISVRKTPAIPLLPRSLLS